jgi:hypothetical protein
MAAKGYVGLSIAVQAVEILRDRHAGEEYVFEAVQSEITATVDAAGAEQPACVQDLSLARSSFSRFSSSPAVSLASSFFASATFSLSSVSTGSQF